MTVSPSAKPFRALIESLNAATVDDERYGRVTVTMRAVFGVPFWLIVYVRNLKIDVIHCRTLVLYLHPMSSVNSYEDEEKAKEARNIQEEFVK